MQQQEYSDDQVAVMGQRTLERAFERGEVTPQQRNIRLRQIEASKGPIVGGRADRRALERRIQSAPFS